MRRREEPASVHVIPVDEIQIDARSRDDIPAILLGLKHLYSNPNVHQEVMELLERRVAADRDTDNGSPEMSLWRILVLATMKEGLGCDYPRLGEYANEHRTLRQMLQHGSHDDHRYTECTLENNVELLALEDLASIGEIVAREGTVGRKMPWRRIRRAGRLDRGA